MALLCRQSITEADLVLRVEIGAVVDEDGGDRQSATLAVRVEGSVVILTETLEHEAGQPGRHSRPRSWR